MKRTNQRYAQVRNKARKSSGKLFEQSFESEPIESEEHLASCVLYINANPHRAQIRACSTYRWSTHALHSGKKDPCIGTMITFDAWYLALGRTHRERAAEYRQRFEDYLRSGPNGGSRNAPGKRPRRPDGSSAS